MPKKTEYDPTAKLIGFLFALIGGCIFLYGCYISGYTGIFNPMYFIFGMIFIGIGWIIKLMGKKEKKEPNPITKKNSVYTAICLSCGGKTSFKDEPTIFYCSHCGKHLKNTGKYDKKIQTTCEKCYGTGICDYCGGSGICRDCDDSKYCKKCGGKGYTKKGHFLKIEYDECDSCHGTGHYCASCNGSGWCELCKGNGECMYCGGNGYN